MEGWRLVGWTGRRWGLWRLPLLDFHLPSLRHREQGSLLHIFRLGSGSSAINAISLGQAQEGPRLEVGTGHPSRWFVEQRCDLMGTSTWYEYWRQRGIRRSLCSSFLLAVSLGFFFLLLSLRLNFLTFKTEEIMGSFHSWCYKEMLTHSSRGLAEGTHSDKASAGEWQG